MSSAMRCILMGRGGRFAVSESTVDEAISSGEGLPPAECLGLAFGSILRVATKIIAPGSYHIVGKRASEALHFNRRGVSGRTDSSR